VGLTELKVVEEANKLKVSPVGTRRKEKMKEEGAIENQMKMTVT
jgi:hypothetical protein